MWYSVMPTWRWNKYLMPNICSCNSSTDYYTGIVTTKRKKERCLFSLFKFLEEKLFSSSSFLSSTRHIIYNYDIKSTFLNILRHIYYFRWIIIQLNISTCLILILIMVLTVISSTFHCKSKSCFSIYLLYSVIFTENLYH